MNYLRQLYTRDTKPFWFQVRVYAVILFIFCVVGFFLADSRLDWIICGVFGVVFGLISIR